MDVSWQAGRIVGDHWRLRDRLGGKRSRYWDAEELRAGNRVVIELSPVDLSDPQARLQFSRETRALIEFRSPHVVRTLHRGLASEGVAFTVAEFLEGEDLGRLLARESALDLQETVQLLEQCCRGILKLDAAGLAQRVLEPEHVFLVTDPLSSERNVKLLVTSLGDGTVDATASQYRSPEPATASETRRGADAAAKVWAFGVLGCRMLTGAMPFDADSRGTLADDWGARFKRLREARNELPVELDEWFRTAIHPDPSSRFASVEHASLALGHIATAHASRQARLRARASAVGMRAAPPPLPSARLTPQRAAAPVRPRSAVLELDRSARAVSAAMIEPQPSPAISRVAAPGSTVLQIPDVDIHQRDTVESRLHAAAKRKRRVQSGERKASLASMASVALPAKLGAARRAELPADLEGARRAELSANLEAARRAELPADLEGARRAELPADVEAGLRSELPFGLREPASLAVRPATAVESGRDVTHAIATIEPASEGAAPGARALGSRSPELATIAPRSDAPPDERAHAFRVERARWRGFALMAVVLGLFGGFALRSLVASKLQTVRLSFSRAAQVEGIPARAVIAQPEPVDAHDEVAGSEPRAPAPASEELERPLRETEPIVTNAPRKHVGTSPRKTSMLDTPTDDAPIPIANDPLPAAPTPIDTTPVQIYRGF